MSNLNEKTNLVSDVSVNTGNKFDNLNEVINYCNSIRENNEEIGHFEFNDKMYTISREVSYGITDEGYLT
jgi:hypothetical protein